MIRTIPCGLALVALLGAQAPQPDPIPFRRVVYMHGGPERTPELYARLRRLGFDAISARPGAADRAAQEAGLTHYVDQAVGKGVLELRDAQWDPVRMQFLAKRNARLLERPACLSDPEVRAGLHQGLAAALDAERGAAWGVCLGDEASATRRANPLDFCFGAHCLARFREHLELRYRSIDELNVAWGTDHSDWEEVLPWGADKIRARELRSGMLPANLTPWSDHLEFREIVWADVVGELAAQSRRAGLPAGLTGMQPPSAYGGYDYHRLMPTQSFYETYDIGGAREMSRAFAPEGALEFATLFPPKPGTPDRFVEAKLLEHVTHGMAGVIVWSCGEALAEDGALRAYGTALQRAFIGTRSVADAFAGARVRYSPIWILESQASVRAHWMLDSIGDRNTWPNRLTSHEVDHSTSMAARLSWLRVIQDVGFQPRFVAAPALATALREGAPRLLVLPASIALGDGAVAAIREYVARGGHVVADHGPARFDARLRRRAKPALDDVFGVRRADGPTALPAVREGRGEATLRMANGLCVAAGDLRGDVFEETDAGWHFHCEHSYERGRATYLNLAVCEYAAARLDPARLAMCRDLRARVRRIVTAAGVAPIVVVRGRGLPPFLETVVVAARDGRTLLSLRMHVLDSPEVFGEAVSRGARDCVLQFAEPVRLVDLTDGTDHGVAREFPCKLDPVRPLMFSMEAGR